MPIEHQVIKPIKKALDILEKPSDSKEDVEIKKIVIFKLKEALLWAEKIYNEKVVEVTGSGTFTDESVTLTNDEEETIIREKI